MIEIRSFRDLLRLFFIFRREAHTAFIVTLVVVVLGAFLLPSKYEANARLLVKPGRDNSTMPIEVSNRQALVSPSTQRDPVVDEEKLLTGKGIARLLARNVLAELDAYQPEGTWELFKHRLKKVAGTVKEGIRNVLVFAQILETKPVEERLAERLLKGFTVTHDTGSNVMELRLVWGDASLAGYILERWIDLYLEGRTRSLGRTSLQGFYERELAQQDEHIKLLKAQLQEHYKSINSAGVRERIEHLMDQTHRLRDLRMEKTNELAGLTRLITEATNQISKYPDEVVVERELSLNPTQLDLKLKLNRLQEERTILLRTYLEGAPQIKKLDESIASMRKLIAGESERLERSQNRAPNSLVISIRQELLDAGLRQERLKQEVEDIDQQLQVLAEERNDTLAKEPEITRLAMQLETAEKSYVLYSDSLEQARIDKALDESLISNISIVEQASSSAGRIFPKTLVLLLLAVPFAASCGLLTIYLCYLVDQRIHDGSKLEERFGVPVWGVLPELEHSQQPSAVFEAGLYRVLSMLSLQQIRKEGVSVAIASAHAGTGSRFVIERLTGLLQAQDLEVLSEVPEKGLEPGQIAVVNAGSLVENPEALLLMSNVQKRIVVIRARQTTVPVLGNALSVLSTAFGKVDGVVLNGRLYEVPATVLRRFEGLRNSF